jgi:hypothetical protein
MCGSAILRQEMLSVRIFSEEMRQSSCRSLDISPGKLTAVRATLSFSSGEFMVIPAMTPVPCKNRTDFL